ncbi:MULTISPECIES: MBL fold metallo-hydrolase [Oceanobacillus]|uniref:Metallo-hydrolase YhfI n=1 Tax=Oceanobacillus kimchii TaxID=746691 RepID=A0ABQ5THN1_9BACI|nr:MULTISPECIES: MBL fold metallo-hydrolase [Oceanobacillus]MBT2599126.1 MBL fold metallo-hydrolase [Oceanobacillus sp. ISL-74]MBT2652044.1 MBL fold metallo-hydrolase [Oceanobacillus sp. ISL-73]MCT1578674.1 MBL fold metallo-hydrolase [Oceanobacillus kimchii]MCT2136277.1 MBL fold metallo-hydrolase [Oceanobacillus kimchii]OEH54311.1 hypothetical protein AQ616_11155 [Oceanobacillus sp. E9]
MKLTVIGCWGGYPAENGSTSSYLLQSGDFRMLIDLGSGALSKLQNYTDIEQIDAIVLSHYHHDHVADIGVFQYAKLINYYVNGNENVVPIYGHTEDEEGFAKLTHTYTKGIEYNPDNKLIIGPFEIEFIQTNHPVPCYGMQITDGKESIVYTADSGFMKEWTKFADRCDLFITDCNYYAGQDGSKPGHMNSEQVGMIARDANVNKLLLSHLPQFGDLQQLKKEAESFYQGPIEIAREGWTWSGN